MKSANGRLTASKRVLVVDNHSILGTGVEELLSNIDQLQIIGVNPADEVDLLQDIWQLVPDVIILSDRSSIISPTQLLFQLKYYPSVRLIVVSEDENTLDIYDKRQIMTRQRADLTTAVQSN